MKKMLSIIVIMGMVLSGLIAGQLFISTTVIAPGPDLPDLTISEQNITVSSATHVVGEPVTINATLWNVGNADATNVEMNFYEEDNLIGTEIVDIPVYGTWINQTLTPIGSSVDRYASIAIDSMNGVHVGYSDYVEEDLKYAYKPNGGSWTFYTIDSTGTVGRTPSIAVDNTNGVHIIYNIYQNSTQKIKYAYKPSDGSWTIQMVHEENSKYPSIAIDDTNGIHVCFRSHNGINYELTYAYKPSGGNWTNYTVDSISQVGIEPSIAIDSDNGIHISYYNHTETGLRYAYKPYGGNWTNYSVDSIDDVGSPSNIAIDSENGAHISYFDSSNSDLKYAYKPSGGSWINYTVDSVDNVGMDNSIAIDDAKGVHIGYRDRTYFDLKYAYKSSMGNWTFDTIDSIGGVGEWPSIVVDYADGIHVIYQDEGNSEIKYANRIAPTRNIQTSISWIPTTAGLRNITVIIDEENTIEELDDTNNEATITIHINDTDSDFDGLTNAKEFSIGSDPHNNDTDGDNLGDGFEVIFSKTEPGIWDTNGNGIGDGLEFIQSKGYLGWIESLPDDWIGMTISWDNYTILVKTNSSVLEGEFDKDEQKLKIKVSGLDGTQGVTEIEVPKSLCEPEDIEILLDGELINYTLTEDDTYYYIHIEYNHSIHELSASFGYTVDYSGHPKGEEEDSLAIIYIMSLIIALIVILLLSGVIIRNKGKRDDIGVQELPPEKLSILLDKKHAEGKISDETYYDAKSLLEKYSGD